MDIVKINVTKEDIKRGKRKDSDHCPVALAARRDLNLPEDCQVSVGRLFVGISSPRGSTSFDLPAYATEFIDEFDRAEKVGPIGFVIRPDDVVRLKKVVDTKEKINNIQ